jgi:hypothetical protein
MTDSRLFQFARVGTFGSRLDTGAATQEPLSQPDDAHAEHPVADQFLPGRGRQLRPRPLFARGSRLCAALGGGHPSREKDERLGSTDRALLAVVNVFAIEAEPGYAELHVWSGGCNVRTSG